MNKCSLALVVRLIYQAAIVRQLPSVFRMWKQLLWYGIVAAIVFFNSITAHAYPVNQCPSGRYGADLNCTAGDVSITGMRVVGESTSCTGGTYITIDLELTINFATPNRWDIGVFISNDGRDPQMTVASGGATSCSASVLPTSSPFLDLDPGPHGGITDTCGDGNNGISGGTGSGIHYMPSVTIACQSLAGSGGNLYIPFVVSWDNQSSPAGGLCRTNADPVPNTKSKCNAPTIAQGTVTVVVMPTISNTDGRTTVSTGETVNYDVVITNTTGATLNNAVFKDPAVTNITVNSVSCAGAACPCITCSISDMQGAGITIPSIAVGGNVTFTINATLSGTPPDTLTNTASVTVGGQTKSASDTDTIVGTIAILPPTLSKSGSSGTLMIYNYTLYNFGGSDDIISLTAISNQGWPVQIRDAADTATISSLTVSAGGSANFIVKVQIPSTGIPLGTVDVTTITSTSGIDSTKKATATAVTTVSSPLTLTPDNIGSGGKSSSVFYDHRVQNNTASSQTATFSVVSNPCGWTVGFYKADKVTQIATVTLGPFGGYEDIEVKVSIPAGAATGSTCAVTVRASAGGNTADATDTTTVKDLVLYSDPGYTDESYLFPAGNIGYAKAFGTLTTQRYRFYWYDSTGALRRTSPFWFGAAALPDSYDIPAAGPLGTWRIEVWTVDAGGNRTGVNPFTQTNFYVGPDHLKASYTGTNPFLNTNVTIPITLHDKLNHIVPLDPSGNLVRGNPPATKDALIITVSVNGSATIVSTTLDTTCTGCGIVGQTVTGRLDTTLGTATVTITDSVKETVTITPSSYNSALYGSPSRDEAVTVTFIKRKKVRILDWREIH